MNFYNIQKITVMDIQVFLKCAELENFTQAATEMQISVASVSKIISSLETGMELILFVRNKNKVHLTPAGRILYDSWKSFEGSFLTAFEQAHKAQKVNDRPIVFGVDSGIDLSKSFSSFLTSWQEHFPMLSSKVEVLDGAVAIKHLLCNAFDLAFLPEHMYAEICNYSELEAIPVLDSVLYACVSHRNPLSSTEALVMEDLKKYGFIIPSPMDSPFYYRWLSGLCLEYGFTPRIDRYISSVSSACLNLAKDNVFVTDSYSVGLQTTAGNLMEISDHRVHIYLAWKKKNENIRKTIQHAKEFYSPMKIVQK